LVLSGQPSGARITVLGEILGSLQGSISAIAQALAAEPTRRGVIPAEIQQAVTLRLALALPGSLALRLVPIEPEESGRTEPLIPLFEEQTMMADGETPASLLDQSIRRLFTIMSEPPEMPSPEWLATVAEVGPRSAGHLRALSKVLADAETSTTLTWHGLSSEAEARVEERAARRLHKLLGEVRHDERERTVTGTLVGASLLRSRFEIEGEDELITGHVHPFALRKLESFFGRTCTARLTVRETTTAGGETQEVYSLVDVSD
jgi:hypothetical protein